jgi:hypothetical protein
MPQLRLHTETEHAELHHTDTAQCAVIHCPEKLALPTLCSVHRQLSTPNFEHTSAQWTGWIRLQQVHTSWQTDGQVAATQCCTGLVCINVAQYLAALTYACTAGHTHTQPAVLCCSVNRDLQPADAKGEARAKQVTVVCGMGVTKLQQPHPPNPPPPQLHPWLLPHSMAAVQQLSPAGYGLGQVQCRMLAPGQQQKGNTLELHICCAGTVLPCFGLQ